MVSRVSHDIQGINEDNREDTPNIAMAMTIHVAPDAHIDEELGEPHNLPLDINCSDTLGASR